MNELLTDEKLLEHIAMGESFSIIALQFKTTRAAIAGRIHRLKKKQAVVVPYKKQMPKPKVFPLRTKPFDVSARAIVPTSPVNKQTNRFFQNKAPELTKSQLREMIRVAVLNTSQM